MEKTNIRLNNFFILINKGLNKYYLTDIDQINDWKELDFNKLSYSEVDHRYLDMEYIREKWE